MKNIYKWAAVATFSLLFQANAHASVEPSCGDRELAHLQIAAAASNLANVNTTHTPEGGAYKKKVAVRHRDGHCEILSVEAFREIHDPSHPDANTEGFVKYPDISTAAEQKTLYEAREKLKKLKKTSSSKDPATDAEIDVD